MDNWISKVSICSESYIEIFSTSFQMGFPVLTVTETPTGIHVRQDRFLETGHVEPKDNETLW